MPKQYLTTKFEPQFSGFHDLMKYRVREILLVSSLYDAFVLEEDGRLAEKIFSEYIDLNLHFIPRITKVSTAKEGLAALREKAFDLVITMARIADMNPVEFGRKVKEVDPEKFVVMLTYDTINPNLLNTIRQNRNIDKVFYWWGESKLLLSIIKYVEDLKNAEDDSMAGVQTILIIEDSPKYYSMFLPSIYTEIMTQTRILIADGVNDLHRMLRMRARPKILITETFEEGLNIYRKFKHNLLGIITDVCFPKGGVIDDTAGFQLARKVKSEVYDLPVLIQSADEHDQEAIENCQAAFLNKNSPNLILELRDFILSNYGFGDFVFRYPDGSIIGRAKNLNEFAEKIRTIPAESLEYHAQRNHFSIWLRARTEFELADKIRPKQASDFEDIEGLRAFIYQSLQELFRQLQQGVIKDFGSSQFYDSNSFFRLGSGSLGGKGRGLAFINAMLSGTHFIRSYPDIDIKTPQTFVIGSEIFEEFLDINHLQKFAIQCNDEEKIVRRFLKGNLASGIVSDLHALVQKVNFPLAVRSSSLLEDSQLLPFAGLYKTYMIPNNHPEPEVRFRQLLDAIRLVYASVFYKAPKEHTKNTDYRVEEEKMAVVVQQLAGQQSEDLFYPTISGIAQSYNFYPISHMKPEDGIVHLALGLGKTIVDGEKVFRFSPAYPQLNLPHSSPLEMINNSQNRFIALDLSQPDMGIKRDENFSLRKLDIRRAEQDGSLFFVASSYSQEDESIKDTLDIPGPRIITFANLLKYNYFPIAEILSNLLKMMTQAFGSHVEIEFALNLFRKNVHKPEFYILQIRPMISGNENRKVHLQKVQEASLLCFTNQSVGKSVYENLKDIVFVNPDKFSPTKTTQIAHELENINRFFERHNQHYILLGFGRWGTKDPWLGIPVEWHQISKAKILVETNLPTFKIDPSQGSHFFHNLVSLKLGYLYISGNKNEGFVAWDWLKHQPPVQKTAHLIHIHSEEDLVVKIDGRSGKGAIFKPSSNNPNV